MGWYRIPAVMADDEVHRYITVLAKLLREQEITGRELSRRLNLKPGTLARLLRGERELRVSQLLDILKVLKVEPLAFYRFVHAETPLTERLMQGLGERTTPPLLVPPIMTEEEFSTRVQEALTRALAAHKDQLKS